MKKLLLFALVLNLCPFLEAQAQSQTPSRKRPKFSPHSRRTGFVKPPLPRFEEIKGDSSGTARQDEKLQNSLPPHWQRMPDLPPHLATERRWLWESENGRSGMVPNDPLDRLYPPHKRPLAFMPTPLQNATSQHSVQSFQSGATQILSGGVQEAWVARYAGPGHAYDIAVAMVSDDLGNIYVTGYSQVSHNSRDYLTVKYNADGVLQWTARYDGPGNAYDTAVALAVDGAGNVYVTGYSAKDFNGTSSDYVTVKYNSAGTQEWVATYNGPGNGKDYAVALGIDPASGDVYVTGYSWSDTSYYDYATVKYNSAGTQQWAATYNGPKNGDDFAFNLAVDGAGNVYVTGYRTPHNNPASNYATVKYNSAGTLKWVRTYNGPGNFHDYAVALTVDGANNVYVTGISWNGKNYDYATIKYNSTGTREWVATYNGPENYHDQPSALAVDGAGNVYVTGSSGTVKYNSAGTQEWVANGSRVALAVDGAGNVYVTGYSGTVKYNSAGNQEWVANGSRVALAVDSAGNVYVTGTIQESNGYPDYATVKYNSAGQEQWLARHDEPGEYADDIATAMGMDGSGNIYVTGSSGTVKYNPAGIQEWAQTYPGSLFALAVDNAGNVYVTGSSNSDYITVKYNTAGQEQWVARYNGPGNSDDAASALGIDAAGNVYVTGMSGNYPYSDYATVKYNSAGQEQWVARYNGPANDYDRANALAVDSHGNVYVTGTIVLRFAEDHYEEDIYPVWAYATIKYNSVGQQQWVAHNSGLYPEYRDNYVSANALAVDGDGNVYVTGTMDFDQWEDEDLDYVTVKYNADGQMQ